MDKKRRAADRDHTQLEEEELEPEVLKRLKEKGIFSDTMPLMRTMPSLHEILESEEAKTEMIYKLLEEQKRLRQETKTGKKQGEVANMQKELAKASGKGIKKQQMDDKEVGKRSETGLKPSETVGIKQTHKHTINENTNTKPQTQTRKHTKKHKHTHKHTNTKTQTQSHKHKHKNTRTHKNTNIKTQTRKHKNTEPQKHRNTHTHT